MLGFVSYYVQYKGECCHEKNTKKRRGMIYSKKTDEKEKI